MPSSSFHAEDGTMDVDQDHIMLDVLDGHEEQEWQDEEEAEIYIGALRDTAQSPYVPFIFSDE